MSALILPIPGRETTAAGAARPLEDQRRPFLSVIPVRLLRFRGGVGLSVIPTKEPGRGGSFDRFTVRRVRLSPRPFREDQRRPMKEPGRGVGLSALIPVRR